MNWLTVKDTAKYSGWSVRTIESAVADGSLHSHQRVQRGKRRLAESAVDAWIRGENEQAQERACGCAGLRAVRSA